MSDWKDEYLDNPGLLILLLNHMNIDMICADYHFTALKQR